MREIKFRAIRKGSKEFLFGDLVHNCEGDAIFPSVLDENALLNSPDYYTINPETIGQFTGLRDKNGNEIYLGDILNDSTGKSMVVGWSDKFASFVLNRDGWAFSHWFGESCNPDDCEIIGNIHQNPELLQS